MSLDAHTSAGIAIAAVSAVLTGTGTVVEKVALRRLPEIHARHFWAMLRTLCSSRQWLWGCACLLGGLICQGLALSLAPISVAQPIFASGIVLLLVLSHFVLHDRLRPVEWFALATIAPRTTALPATTLASTALSTTTATVLALLRAGCCGRNWHGRFHRRSGFGGRRRSLIFCLVFSHIFSNAE